MRRPDDAGRLQDMLEHGREALAMVAGRERRELDDNRMLNPALTRLLEIVGEAASRVTTETQARHREVAWAGIIGLRNRIVHGYGEVDLDIAWQVLTVDLPLLVAALERIVAVDSGA